MSLKYRIALIIFILEALMMGAVLTRTISRFDRDTRRHLGEMEDVVLELLTGVGRGVLLTREYGEMQRYLEQAGRDSRVLRAMLADHRGVVVASLDGGDVGAPLPPPSSSSSERFWRRVSISNASGVAGTVAVEFSNAQLMEESASIRRDAIAIAVVGMSLIAVVGIATGMLLTQKLARVSGAARKLAAGDLGTRSGVSGSDEIGRLGRSFDEMASALETDRSQLAASEARLRQAQKMEAIGLLAGGVAHDFNNILTVISGYSDLMLCRDQKPERERLEAISKAARRASGLTQQLLAFSRQQVLQPRVMNLNAAIAESNEMLRRVIGEDIEIVRSLEPTLSLIKADPGQIQQVLMNLALNARDAMTNGGRLSFETGNVSLGEAEAARREGLSPGTYVQLFVRDTGVGMSPDVLSRVFEPFFTTKEVGRGTGLGLSTVYGIVKQSGGYVYASSVAERGSVFEILLPRADEVAGAPSDPAPTQTRRGFETILLVEDEPSVRDVVRDVLVEHGYRVLEAPNGRAALEVLEEHRGEVLLVLTDLVMPGMNGPQLATEIKSLHPEIRVLFTTGYFGGAPAPFLANREHLLQKPFSVQQLLGKLREVLDTPALS